jgi:hypothetical protein
MSVLGAFSTLVVEFFEDISEQYPEEKDISLAAKALKLLKKTNPRLIHTGFTKAVTADLKADILAEDEDAVIVKAKAMLNSKYAAMNYAFWIFDKHWSTMSETNKQHVWRYIKAMLILADRVPASAE